jgi:hypothetical protein
MPDLRGFNLSEHITCERAFSKPFIWVKDAESPLRKGREALTGVGRVGFCRLLPRQTVGFCDQV